MLKEGIKYFKDVLFPVRCLNCQKEGEWVCKECFALIDLRGLNGDDHWAITNYHDEKLIGKIIRSFKYNYIKELSGVFKDMIGVFLRNHSNIFKDVDLIVPVPLHKKRLAERGFNQSEVISLLISELINRSVDCVLIRKNNTEHQARLNKENRLVNVQSAFVCKKIIDGHILLVDDVFTTGSTIFECKKVLLDSGAEKVTSFTIAKG